MIEDLTAGTVKLAACRGGRGRVAERDDYACLSQLRRPPVSSRDHQPRGLAVFPLPAEPAHGRGDAGCTRHGIVKLAACRDGRGRVAERDDNACLSQLCRPPVSGRGHQPRRLAVLPLPAQPAHGRGDAGRARHHRQPRDACGNGRSSSARTSPTGSGGGCPAPGDKWHLDEVVIKIAGKKHWLWRAVDQDGIVLDILVQSRRDKRAAKRLLRKLLKRQCRAPRVMITDKLASYGAAKEGDHARRRAPAAQGLE